MNHAASVMIIEDEIAIALLLEDMLISLGYHVVAKATSYTQAISLAESDCRADVAICDINLAGELSYPAALRLSERGTAIIFVSGYAYSEPPSEFENSVMIRKPYFSDDIATAINQVVRLERT